MDNEIIDSLDIEKIKPRIKEYIIPILILALFIYSMYYRVIKNLILDPEDYLAFILIGLTTILSLINKKYMLLAQS